MKKTPEEILSEHTGEVGIYLTKGMIRGSDALEAMRELFTQCQQDNVVEIIHFATWYSGMEKEKVINAYNMYLREIKKLNP